MRLDRASFEAYHCLMSVELFSSVAFNGITIRNRCFAAAMATQYADKNGRVSDRLLNSYRRLAESGVGMVFVEGAAVVRSGCGWSRQLGVYDHTCLPGLQRLVAAIEKAGSFPWLQLYHAGRQSFPSGADQTAPAVSPLPCPIIRRPVRVLTRSNIQDLLQAFVQAADLAQRAGFPGIELHGAHGYLLHQFTSPLTNKRRDEFGLDGSGLCRFPLDLVHAIKKSCPGLLISYRLSACDYLPRGLEISTSVGFARALEQSGVDFISVSGGAYGALRGPRSVLGPGSSPAPFRADAGALRQAVKIPVGVTGKIQQPAVAHAILQAKDADFIGLARMLLRDPGWLHKANSKQEQAIRHCLLCVKCRHFSHGCPDQHEDTDR